MESYVTCPFNKTHRILKARLQTHLLKCRKNYPKNKKVVCPFDATHMLDPEEYDHHLSICPTSGNIKCYQTILEPVKKVGASALEKACQLQTITMDEDWSGNNPTYDPLAATENKNIIRTAIGLTKSKKKQFKKQERDRISTLENIGCVNNIKSQDIVQKTAYLEQPLRAPKNTANALTYSQNNSSTLTNDLILKLKDVSIQKNNSLLMKENDSSMSNNTSKDRSSPENNFRCNITNSFNISLCSINISEQEQEESTSKKGSNTTAKCENISEISKKTREEEDVSIVNKSKIQGNYKNIGTQNNAFQKSFDKQNDLKSQNTSSFHLRMANFYGEAKKISTGRGFTIAYKNLNNNHSEPGTGKEKSLNLSSTFGYDED